MTNGVRLYPCANGCNAQVKHRLAFCNDCRVIAKKVRAANTLARKEREGECIRCSKPAKEGRRFCQDHLWVAQDYSHGQYRAKHPVVKRVFRCGRCSEEGHTAKTCSKPKPEWVL